MRKGGQKVRDKMNRGGGGSVRDREIERVRNEVRRVNESGREE